MMFQVKVVKDIWTEEDEGGKVRFATVQVHNLGYIIINQMNCHVKDFQSLNHHFRKDLKQLPLFQTYGDTTHTFVERQKFNGLFLPGYKVLSIDRYLISDYGNGDNNEKSFPPSTFTPGQNMS